MRTSLLRGDSLTRLCLRMRLRALCTMLETESLEMGTAVGSVSLDSAWLMSAFSEMETEAHRDDVSNKHRLRVIQVNKVRASKGPQTWHRIQTLNRIALTNNDERRPDDYLNDENKQLRGTTTSMFILSCQFSFSHSVKFSLAYCVATTLHIADIIQWW